jgi:hypothetical protein
MKQQKHPQSGHNQGVSQLSESVTSLHQSDVLSDVSDLSDDEPTETYHNTTSPQETVVRRVAESVPVEDKAFEIQSDRQEELLLEQQTRTFREQEDSQLETSSGLSIGGRQNIELQPLSSDLAGSSGSLDPQTSIKDTDNLAGGSQVPSDDVELLTISASLSNLNLRKEPDYKQIPSVRVLHNLFETSYSGNHNLLRKEIEPVWETAWSRSWEPIPLISANSFAVHDSKSYPLLFSERPSDLLIHSFSTGKRLKMRNDSAHKVNIQQGLRPDPKFTYLQSQNYSRGHPTIILHCSGALKGSMSQRLFKPKGTTSRIEIFQVLENDIDTKRVLPADNWFSQGYSEFEMSKNFQFMGMINYKTSYKSVSIVLIRTEIGYSNLSTRFELGSHLSSGMFRTLNPDVKPFFNMMFNETSTLLAIWQENLGGHGGCPEVYIMSTETGSIKRLVFPESMNFKSAMKFSITWLCDGRLLMQNRYDGELVNLKIIRNLDTTEVHKATAYYYDVPQTDILEFQERPSLRISSSFPTPSQAPWLLSLQKFLHDGPFHLCIRYGPSFEQNLLLKLQKSESHAIMGIYFESNRNKQWTEVVNILLHNVDLVCYRVDLKRLGIMEELAGKSI